ncbi:MAG: hypothetical protein ACKVJK_21515 [Methylophagaceae bacterium]
MHLVDFKMKLFQLSSLLFFLIIMISCSEKEEEKLIIEDNKAITLNSKNIEIPNVKFIELNTILSLKNDETGNCHNEKLDNFFKSLSMPFNKNDFEITLDKGSFKTTYVFLKSPHGAQCSKLSR